jgi:TRAP transporter 4TM/12TM fusion protein
LSTIQKAERQPRDFREAAFNVLAVVLSVFVLVVVNTVLLDDQPTLALFGMLGLALVFLQYPAFRGRWGRPGNLVDGLLIAATVVVFGYIFVQSESRLSAFWVDDTLLGDRAGNEKTPDFVLALIGVLLIIEATRRSIGWTLPILCLLFVLYGFYGQSMPDWMFPHRGASWQDMSQKTFLQSGTMGVFGIALNVMFKYVFLFVLFGTVLEQTGATGYIIRLARGIFRNSSGGPAKVAVLSSGLMGSLSGSAVANTATTGTLTIPLMKSSGFRAETAAGIEAAASSGGALMPPIMGAGAYMMLEIVPDVTLLKVIQAALIPAILYYLALLLTVHFQSCKIGAAADTGYVPESDREYSSWQGVVFFGSFAILIALLLYGYSPYRSVSLSLAGMLALSLCSPRTRLDIRKIMEAMIQAGKSGTALIVAASCVGIILGIVDMSGLGPALPAKVQLLAGDSGFLALLLLMFSTIVLGMGLPSAVCYLLVALTVGSVLTTLNTPPLAAHLFIFYFGMMSMVTPPVALAAYAGAAIAKADVMRSAMAAFRFALVGFALPFAFVFRPELLMLTAANEPASPLMVTAHVAVTLVGIVGLAAAMAGYAFSRLGLLLRLLLLVPSLAIFLTRWEGAGFRIQMVATAVVAALLMFHFWRRPASSPVRPGEAGSGTAECDRHVSTPASAKERPSSAETASPGIAKATPPTRTLE